MKHTRTLTLLIVASLMIGGGAALLFFRDRQAAIVTPEPKPAQIAEARTVAAAVVAANAPQTDASAPLSVSSEPVRLSVASAGIYDLRITPGVYDAATRQWTLTRDKAQHAVITPEPNTSGGNTFIYGHYRRGVFSSLHKAQPGASAVVTTRDGRTFTYVLTRTVTVSPDQSEEVFNYRGKPMLTLQTCSGLFFEQRQLFFFELVSVA